MLTASGIWALALSGAGSWPKAEGAAAERLHEAATALLEEDPDAPEYVGAAYEMLIEGEQMAYAEAREDRIAGGRPRSRRKR